MHTHSRKTKKRAVAIAIALSLAVGSVANAQNGGNQPKPSGNPAEKGAPKVEPNAAAKAPGGAENASPTDTATTSALDYLFNRKAKDGSTAAKGGNVADAISTKAIADEAMQGVSSDIDPEFESYLNSPEENQDMVTSYGTLLDETVEYLKGRKNYDAIANLSVLSRYTWDSRISEQLYNRVMALRDARLNQQELEGSNSQLEAKIKQANWNADQLAEKVRKDEADYMRRQSLQSRKVSQQDQKGQQSKGKSAFLPNPEDTQQAVSSVMGRLQLTEEYFNSLDSRARVRLQEKEIEKIEAEARNNFQEFVGVLYEGQRHHHARLAADFYRVLFGDGDLPTEMASQATAASEIITRVANDVEVFKFKAAKGEMANATRILRETFMLSRYHPALRTVSRDEKLKVADYVAELQKLKNMVEARDFGSLENALTKLEETVTDFDATKPRALVNAVKLESNMRLGMAKLAAQQGELEKAMEEFRSASQAWPGNPNLAEASGQFFSSQDLVNKGTEEFDRAYKAEDYRLVFDQQLAFATAVRGDADREDQLRNALETVKAAELALEKAKLLERNRDPFGAWEALEIAAEDWPEDSALNRRRADMAVRASEFVSSVSKARDAETTGDYGYSLTWFLNAQGRYPASQLANDGITRVTDRIFGRYVPEIKETEPEKRVNEEDSPKADKSSEETPTVAGSAENDPEGTGNGE